MLLNKEIESLESKYLDSFYHFLMFSRDTLLEGLNSKKKIRNHWFNEWYYLNNTEKKQSYSVGAERVIYSQINSRGIGIPNSTPVGSDLFFETDDAFIHIDLKTVQINNIGDINTSIFVGNNQNSYKSNILVNGHTYKYKSAHLPVYYTYKKNSEEIKKPCLTYFISILHEEETFETLMINIMCMPNGQLSPIYTTDVLKAGKTVDPKLRAAGEVSSIRFNFSKCQQFRLLENKKRIYITYMNIDFLRNNPNINKKLELINNLYTLNS